jgi:hypothetical protein
MMMDGRIHISGYPMGDGCRIADAIQLSSPAPHRLLVQLVDPSIRSYLFCT